MEGVEKEVDEAGMVNYEEVNELWVDEDAATTSTDDSSKTLKKKVATTRLPSFNGITLHPPAKKQKRSSPAWNYGGFFKVDGKIDFSRTMCGFCGLIQKYSSTPSNLANHLRGKHNALLDLDMEDHMVNTDPLLNS